MPHIIVEYAGDIKIPEMLAELHSTLAREASVDMMRLKTRAMKFDDVIIADKGPGGQMVHVTLKAYPRPAEIAQGMALDLQNVVRKYVAPEAPISVEVVELNPNTYCT